MVHDRVLDFFSGYHDFYIGARCEIGEDWLKCRPDAVLGQVGTVFLEEIVTFHMFITH